LKTVNSTAFPSLQFSVLSEGQLEELHLAALELLRRTGVRFHHRRALEMLREAGAFISDGNLVKFPACLVEMPSHARRRHATGTASRPCF
jgi:trimethylamine--corrinoid protein Co-methyltransferase